MSTPLRESFERASLPPLTFLSGLPRFVPFLVILVLAVAGVLIARRGAGCSSPSSSSCSPRSCSSRGPGSPAERLMRLAVMALMATVHVTQAPPRLTSARLDDDSHLE